MADKEVKYTIRAVDATRAGVAATVSGLAKVARAGVAAGKKVLAAFRGVGSFIARQARRAAIGIAVISVASIKMAADAEEAANKFAVVFGEAAEEVGNKVDEMARRTKQSSTEMRGLAADVGDMVKAMGFGAEEAGALSVQLLELAVDTASFKNQQVDDVILAFTSALTGEREMLKRLGAGFTEVELKAELMGTATTDATKVTKELTAAQSFAAASMSKTGKAAKKQSSDYTQAQKATATLNILTRKLADSQGDMERTSGSLTNRFRSLIQTIRDAGREYGAQLAAGLGLADMFGVVRDKIDGFVAALKESKAVEKFAGRAREMLTEVVDLIDRVSMGGETGAEALREIGAKFKTIFDMAADRAGAIIEEWGPRIGEAIRKGFMGTTSVDERSQKMVDRVKSESRFAGRDISGDEAANERTSQTDPFDGNVPDIRAFGGQDVSEAQQAYADKLLDDAFNEMYPNGLPALNKKKVGTPVPEVPAIPLPPGIPMLNGFSAQPPPDRVQRVKVENPQDLKDEVS